MVLFAKSLDSKATIFTAGAKRPLPLSFNTGKKKRLKFGVNEQLNAPVNNTHVLSSLRWVVGTPWRCRALQGISTTNASPHGCCLVVVRQLCPHLLKSIETGRGVSKCVSPHYTAASWHQAQEDNCSGGMCKDSRNALAMV